MRVVITGARELARDLDRGGRRLPSAVEKAVRLASELLVGAAQREMQGSRTRAIRLGRAITARPGVLGIDYGRLRQSMSYTVERRGRLIRGEVGPRVVYARIHELGGVAGRGARIPRRPYLAPAIKKTASKILKLLGRAFSVVPGA